MYQQQTRSPGRTAPGQPGESGRPGGADQQGGCENPQVEQLLRELANRLSKMKGKKVYGYLRPELKSLVNQIVDELAKDERIAQLYDLWYQDKQAARNVLR